MKRLCLRLTVIVVVLSIGSLLAGAGRADRGDDRPQESPPTADPATVQATVQAAVQATVQATVPATKQSFGADPLSREPAKEYSSTKDPGAPTPPTFLPHLPPRPSQPPAATTQPPKAKSLPVRNVDPHALSEILRLRKQMGSLLKGSVLDSAKKGETQQAFANSLQKVITENPFPRPPRVSDHMVRTRLPAPPSPLIADLRRVARVLDNRANDHEDREQFADADRIRQLAQQLRVEARAMRGVRPQTTRSQSTTRPTPGWR